MTAAVLGAPPGSRKTIARAASLAVDGNTAFQYEVHMLHEVWDKVVDGMDFLKAVVFGEFVDHRPISVLLTEAMASFVPGVAIVQSVRDTVAICLRLIYHPEKRSEWTEWVLLAVNLVVIFLPVVIAAVQAVVGATRRASVPSWAAWRVWSKAVNSAPRCGSSC